MIHRLPLFLLLFLSLSISANAQRSLRSPIPVIREDTVLVMRDGAAIECTMFVPTIGKPTTGWPVLVYCHGYGDSKDSMLTDAEAQAAYGYITFAYSMRGQGESGGKSHLISRVEAEDLKEVVTYIKRDKRVNEARIGIFGGSQGGIIPFMAACMGMDVRCILSDFASPEFASSWIENGCVKMTLFWTVDYDTLTVRYDNAVRKLRAWILSPRAEHWDSLAINMPIGRDFQNIVPNCKVPVLITNAWQDKFFNATGMIRATEYMTAPFMAYYGALNGHGADSSWREDRFISWYDNAWIEYWLNDIPNGILDTNRYHFAVSRRPLNSGEWTFGRMSTDIWPLQGTTTLPVYFETGNALTFTPPAKESDSVALVNEVTDSTLSMLGAINNAFTGPWFKSRFAKHAVVFETPILNKDYLMVGAPKLHFTYSSDATVSQFNFQIWDIRALEDAGFVTRVNFTERHGVPYAESDTTVEGLAHAHLFRRGGRIRVVLTNLDTESGDEFLGTNPYVLPVLRNSINTMHIGSRYLSRIEIPVVELSPTGDVTTPPVNPLSPITLEQNHPNPFNDKTTISFSLSLPSHVRLRIVDLLGRTIATVPERYLEAGRHETQFELRVLPSGVYVVQAVTSNGIASMKIVCSNR